MKTKLFTLAVLSLMATVSCSKDEIISIGSDPVADNTIGFTTYSSTNSAVRGVPVEGNSTFAVSGTSFSVVGYTLSDSKDVEYLDTKVYYLKSGETNTEITTAVSADGWHYADPQLWPATSMDFYALYSPKQSEVLTATITSDLVETLSIADYTVSTTIADQEDLMYAAAIDQTNATSNQVTIPFQHALTQINFVIGMGSAYSDLKLDVASITINNVSSKETFSFEDNASTASANICSWTYGATAKEDYTIAPSSVLSFVAGTDTTDGTSDGIDYKSVTTSAGDKLMLIPQLFSSADVTASTPSTTDAYLSISCKLYTSKGVYYLGSSSAYANANIALASVADASSTPNSTSPAWVAGRNITYTIVFGQSGTTPGGGGYDEDGDPVLSPISFTTSVASWTPVGGTLTM